MRRYFVLGIAVILTSLACALYVRLPFVKSNTVARALPAANVAGAADMLIEDMYLIEQTVAGDGWQLFARDASFYDTQQVVFLHHVRAQRQSDTLQSIYIEADAGQFNSATGNMSVRGGVQLKYLQEYTIETDVLHWQASSRALQTDTAVKIISAFVQIAGVGLDGNADQQNFVLRDAVHASFQLQ